jgi:hypothetical protein
MYKIIKVGGGLIVVYFLAAYATGFGKLFLNVGTATGGVIKNFQGRG